VSINQEVRILSPERRESQKKRTTEADSDVLATKQQELDGRLGTDAVRVLFTSRKVQGRMIWPLGKPVKKVRKTDTRKTKQHRRRRKGTNRLLDFGSLERLD